MSGVEGVRLGYFWGLSRCTSLMGWNPSPMSETLGRDTSREDGKLFWEETEPVGDQPTYWVRRACILFLDPGRLTNHVFSDIVQGPTEWLDTRNCARVRDQVPSLLAVGKTSGLESWGVRPRHCGGNPRCQRLQRLKKSVVVQGE